MRNELSRTTAVTVLAVALFAGSTSAQTPAPAAQSAAAGQVGVGPGSSAAPTYLEIPLEITVNRPVAEVWKRVGKYCDIAEWLQIAAGCTITSGKEGQLGAVRSVAAEVLVGQSQYSYTYTQTPAFQARGGRPYNMYHGTLEARPVTATTTRLLYTLVFDNSMLADDAAREKDRLGRVATFTRALENMKILAEGGKLPPPPARGGAAPAATPPPPGR